MAQEEIIGPILTASSKKNLIEKYQLKNKDLVRRQRDYKKVLLVRLKTRVDTIAEKSYEHSVQQLTEERDDLRARIFVSTGAVHKQDNDNLLKEIKCHVSCGEHLARDIHQLKVDIFNMDREIGRVDRQVYDLNRRTIPDSQHQAHVQHARKILNILENQLEVGIHRECSFAAKNADLREEIIMMLHHRAYFNEIYRKLIIKLNSDKKYLIDLIEYALNIFENCIDVHEKIDYVTKKQRKERDQRKIEMQGIMRKIAATEETQEFLHTKSKIRKLADLQPKEYARRDRFRYQHNKKINLYKSVLKKILGYTQSHNVDEVIEKFQQQESLYYSYFSFANELSFHMTLLNNSVNKLHSNVLMLKTSNRRKHDNQVEMIAALEKTLQEKQENTNQLRKVRETTDNNLDRLLQGIESIFNTCRTDISPLLLLLGDHTHVNLVNVRRFLKLLETRLIRLVGSVYVMERMDSSKGTNSYIVKDIIKIQNFLTDLDDIVLTQQCPECAEGEAFNVEDRADGGVAVYTLAEAKKNLYEKITQPEMQYRLHSLSQCRLPRSRMLAAKRNM